MDTRVQSTCAEGLNVTRWIYDKFDEYFGYFEVENARTVPYEGLHL